MPDLARYPELRLLDRFDVAVPALLARCCTARALARAAAPELGTSGAQLLVWGFCISTVALYHATFTINSLAHRFGARRYATRDDSRNNLWLALLTFGEGWHNNHHHFPGAARQGFYWWEIDLSLLRPDAARRARPRLGPAAGARRRARRAPRDARRMKIAIIGSGIAGNVAAHRPAPRARHHGVRGGRPRRRPHAHARRRAGGPQLRRSTPASSSSTTAPTRTSSALLEELGVASQESSMSFSVRDEASGLEYNGTSLNTLFAQRRNLLRPSFLGMVRDILRFNREAPALLDEPRRRADARRASSSAGATAARFVDHYLVPMGAAIWSTDPAAHARLSRRASSCASCTTTACSPSTTARCGARCSGGSRALRRAAHRAVSPRASACDTPVRVDPALRGRRGREGARHEAPSASTPCSSPATATRRSRCSPTRAPPSARCSARSLPAQRGGAAHRHAPAAARRLAWAAWNYHVLPGAADRVALTYNMNILQRLDAPEPFLRHAEPRRRDRPGARPQAHRLPPSALHARARSPRRRASARSTAAARTYYCGAYWRYGFHEDGVVSALEALRHFRADLAAARRAA